MYDESIFGGIPMASRRVNLQQVIRPNLCNAIPIASMVFGIMIDKDIRSFKYDKLNMTLEEFYYYWTALIWFRILDVRMKNHLSPLTSTEKKFHGEFTRTSFSIPKPMQIYLASIGNCVSEYKEHGLLYDFALPIAKNIFNMYGYHSPTIDANSYRDYEEIPCLGIMGDSLMALCRLSRDPVEHGLDIPVTSRISKNLCGHINEPSPVSPLYKSSIHRMGITESSFREDVASTRLNMSLMYSVSTRLSSWLSKMDIPSDPNFNLTDLSRDGASVMTIQTNPIPEPGQLWYDCDAFVRSSKLPDVKKNLYDAAIYCGFQLYKERVTGVCDDETRANLNWCCLEPQPDKVWEIPPEWIKRRNDNRRLSGSFGVVTHFTNKENQGSLRIKIIGDLMSK